MISENLLDKPLTKEEFILLQHVKNLSQEEKQQFMDKLESYAKDIEH